MYDIVSMNSKEKGADKMTKSKTTIKTVYTDDNYVVIETFKENAILGNSGYYTVYPANDTENYLMAYGTLDMAMEAINEGVFTTAFQA